MVTIINYGMGNLESVANMIKKVGAKAAISSRPDEIAAADKLILPGVGSFDAGMQNLAAYGLVEVLRQKVVDEHVPLLGICLGMQLLARSSEEGKGAGLGFIDSDVKRFSFGADTGLKIPHMGWNTVTVKKESRLFAGLELESRFYFVHSYHTVCRDPKDVLATTSYGLEFTAAVEKGNILGVQFHPEKSHRFGMLLLKNFIESY